MLEKKIDPCVQKTPHAISTPTMLELNFFFKKKSTSEVSHPEALPQKIEDFLPQATHSRISLK